MSVQGYEQLTLFQEDSLASLFPLPGNEKAREMTVSSGRKCFELYGSSCRLGSLVKMCLESSIWHSTRCLLTWKTRDTPRRRLLFRLVPWTRRTDATESRFWPTPKASSPLGGASGARKTLQAMKDAGLITEEERRMFASGNGGKINPELLEWLMGYEKAFTQLIPTPTATDYKGGISKRFYGGVRWSSEKFIGMHSAWDNWPDEPGVGRVVNGIPNRVDRIRCLGNAVVPQQFYPFFLFIKMTMEAENDGY